MNTHGGPPNGATSKTSKCSGACFYIWGEECQQGNNARSPVTPHPARDVVASFLGLREDDGLVLLLRHDLLHQLDQPEEVISHALGEVLDGNGVFVGFSFINFINREQSGCD